MRLSRPSLPKIFTCLLALAFSTTGKAQDLYLGAGLGLNIPVQAGVQKGIYFRSGAHGDHPILEFSGQFVSKNRISISGGFGWSNFNLGTKPVARNWPGAPFFAYPGTLVLLDLHVGAGYRFPLGNRLSFHPELTCHALLKEQSGYGGGTTTFRDGTKVIMSGDWNKPGIVPAISAVANWDWKLKNGMLLRAGCRFEMGFGNVAETEIRVEDGSGYLIESYSFTTTLWMLQPVFGVHYPISRIWNGKPE